MQPRCQLPRKSRQSHSTALMESIPARSGPGPEFYFPPASATGVGTFLVPASSAPVCRMLRVEKALKNPQQCADGETGDDAGVVTCGQSPYFSLSAGITASTRSLSLLPAACALATSSRKVTR